MVFYSQSWSLGNVDVVTLMEVWLSYRLNLCLGSTLSFICDLCCSKYIYKCVCVCVCELSPMSKYLCTCFMYIAWYANTCVRVPSRMRRDS